MALFANYTGTGKDTLVMYVDMNSYFASCEQQRHPELRNRPVGVVTYDSPNASVIAASIEAKRCGVKTGMRLPECRALCPQIIPVTTHPAWYRQIHVDIMTILRSYCDDVMAKSIDEAVMNFTSYRLVYKDMKVVANQIKADIRKKYDYLSCSIGIAPNSFLAKLGTELQKPDGLIQITPENIDGYLATMKLTDLPGIAAANEKRLTLIGIRNPLELRHSSPALLRKAFGGIVGEYWYRRLNFGEVDLYSHDGTKTMSATRTVSSRQSQHQQDLESMFIALCTRLEQRMVKQEVFCKGVSFYVRYRDSTSWETAVKLADPVQDAMELRSYIQERMAEYTAARKLETLFTPMTLSMGVAVYGFVTGKVMQYSLFDNRMKKDLVRRAMYNIKDKYGKNTVRKGSELFVPDVMKDAIGFGSVKDMIVTEGEVRNKYLLEEDN
jgi:DNA polymerase IV